MLKYILDKCANEICYSAPALLIELKLLGYVAGRYVSILYKFGVDWVKAYGVMANNFQSSAPFVLIG